MTSHISEKSHDDASSKAKGHREERLAALLVLRQLAGGPLAGTIVEGVQPFLGAGDVGNIYIGYMLIIGCLNLEVHIDDVRNMFRFFCGCCVFEC